MARLVLADDHPIYVQGLARLVETEHEVLAVAKDGAELLSAIEDHRPEVVITDISMPGMNGIEVTRQIAERFPRIKVVLLTMHEVGTFVEEALDAGASGYVLKHADLEQILTAVEEVQAGEVFISPELVGGVLKERHRRGDSQPLISTLTDRQREVLTHLVRGRSAGEIAAALHLSRRTIEYHKYRLMEELGVKTSAELIQYALKHGIGDV